MYSDNEFLTSVLEGLDSLIQGLFSAFSFQTSNLTFFENSRVLLLTFRYLNTLASLPSISPGASLRTSPPPYIPCNITVTENFSIFFGTLIIQKNKILNIVIESIKFALRFKRYVVKPTNSSVSNLFYDFQS